MLSIKTQQYRADHKSAELQLSFLILGHQEFIVCLVLTDPLTKLSKEASFRLSYFLKKKYTSMDKLLPLH